MREIYKSSMFEAIIIKNVLVILFTKNKLIYLYRELKPETIKGFVESESKGKYFLANIKNDKFEKTDFKTFEETEKNI